MPKPPFFTAFAGFSTFTFESRLALTDEMKRTSEWMSFLHFIEALPCLEQVRGLTPHKVGFGQSLSGRPLDVQRSSFHYGRPKAEIHRISWAVSRSYNICTVGPQNSPLDCFLSRTPMSFHIVQLVQQLHLSYFIIYKLVLEFLVLYFHLQRF